MDGLNSFLNSVNNGIWGPLVLPLLIGTGLFLTFKLGFIQVRYFSTAMSI